MWLMGGDIKKVDSHDSKKQKDESRFRKDKVEEGIRTGSRCDETNGAVRVILGSNCCDCTSLSLEVFSALFRS